jgi:hypothetical protein
MSIENHKWVRLPSGEVNEAYLDHNTHKGPFCVNCFKFFCLQCEKDLGLNSSGSASDGSVDYYLPKCEANLDNEVEAWSPIGGELAVSLIERKVHA